MAKFTTGQIANSLNISPYTLKRWYEFWEKLEKDNPNELQKLIDAGMPTLPNYEVFGARGDRIWDEECIPQLKLFQQWIPNTRNGIFAKYLKEDN